MTIFSVRSEHDDLLKKLKEQTRELSGIKNAIINLQEYISSLIDNDTDHK